MKYSDVKDLIAENVAKYSKSIDKAIDLLTVAEDITYAKNIKLYELRNYQIKCLYDFAEYDGFISKIEYSNGSDVINRANTINAEILKKYIHTNILFCGTSVSMYLKIIRDWMIDDKQYAIKDQFFNNGVLFGMKIKCLPNSVIPTDEFFYVDNETDKIIKCKVEGVN